MFTNKLNKILIVLVFCLFASTAFSQTVYSNKESSSFAFTLGMTSSNLYNDTVKYTSGILFNGGFVYTLSFSDKLSGGIELLYTGKAFKQDPQIIKYRFMFIDVPVYVQYKFSDNIRADLGVQYSVLSGSNVSMIDGSRPGGIDIRNIQTSVNNDYGILLGVEVDVIDNLAIGARYTYSAKSFINKNDPYFGVFQLSFKYTAFRSYKQIFHKKEAIQ